MKNYGVIYGSLRKEIMNQIKSNVAEILAKHNVECLSDLDNAPSFLVYTEQYVDDGYGNEEPMLVRVVLTQIYSDGECAGYEEFDKEPMPYQLYELTTDSLIDVYERLCKYLS